MPESFSDFRQQVVNSGLAALQDGTDKIINLRRIGMGAAFPCKANGVIKSIANQLPVCTQSVEKSPAGAGLFLIDMVEWARVMKRCWNAGKWIETW